MFTTAETSNLIGPAGQSMSPSKRRQLVLSGHLTVVWMVHLSHLLTVAAAGGERQTDRQSCDPGLAVGGPWFRMAPLTDTHVRSCLLALVCIIIISQVNLGSVFEVENLWTHTHTHTNVQVLFPSIHMIVRLNDASVESKISVCVCVCKNNAPLHMSSAWRLHHESSKQYPWQLCES